MDHDRIVSAYTKMRKKRSEIKKAYEEEDEALKGKMEKLETVLLKHLLDTKTNSVNTDAGTFYKQVEMIPQGADWDAFYAWVKKENAFDALERRIKKTFISEYMENNDDALPPGVTVHRRNVVRIRKS